MNPDTWTKITLLAAHQLGMLSHEQLLRAGCSERTLRRALERGLLIPVRKCVYMVAGVPESPWQPVMSACLAVGSAGVASHRAAAGLYGAPGFLAGTPELTVAGSRPRLAGVRVHLTDDMPDHHRTVRLGIPVTTPARLVLDAPSWLPEYRVRQVLDHVLRRKLCQLDDVVRAWQRRRGQQLRGSAVLERLLGERWNGLKSGDSDYEVELVKMLIDAGIEPPVQQYEVAVNGRLFFLDLAWPRKLVACEFLGFDPHGTMRSVFDNDAERTALLTAIGWRIVPVTSRSKPGIVVGTVRRLLR